MCDELQSPCKSSDSDRPRPSANTLAGQEGRSDLIDVGATLTQSRQFECDHVQAVIKVFTELANFGQAFQVRSSTGSVMG